MRVGIAGPIGLSPLVEHLDLSNGNLEDMPSGLGGSPVVHQVLEMLGQGDEVSVYTLDKSICYPRIYTGTNLKVYVFPYRSRARDRVRDLFKTEREGIKHAIQMDRPDIVHAHWTYEFALGALDSGAPNLITAHDAPASILRYTPDLYRLVRYVMAQQVVYRATKISAVSEYVKTHLERFFIGRPEISVVPNGLPPALFPRAASAQREDRTAPVFATVLQGWSTLKNGSAALEGFQMARLKAPGIKLLMFGEGFGSGQAANAWATSRGLAERVEFVGRLEYVRLVDRLQRDADVLLHPSLEEACPMAVIEAMHLGLPTIGGIRSGGVPFTLDQKSGLLIDVTDPRSIADAILQLASEPSTRHSMGSHARSVAHSKYSISKVVDQYRRLYVEILESSK